MHHRSLAIEATGRKARERERSVTCGSFVAAARSTPSSYKTLNKTLFLVADTMCKRRERMYKCASLLRTSFQKTSSSSSSSSRLFEKVRILRTFALRFERLLRRERRRVIESSNASTSRNRILTFSKRQELFYFSSIFKIVRFCEPFC